MPATEKAGWNLQKPLRNGELSAIIQTSMGKYGPSEKRKLFLYSKGETHHADESTFRTVDHG
jgi:hypothetical protein